MRSGHATATQKRSVPKPASKLIHKRRSAFEERGRKEHLLTQGHAAVSQSIADAVVIKDCNLFFLTRSNGLIPSNEEHGLGLYYNDCRFLNGYDLRVADQHLTPLASASSEARNCSFELTNDEISLNEASGGKLEKQKITLSWQRELDGDQLQLNDSLIFRNFSSHAIDIPVTLDFAADFKDVFQVRGFKAEKRGEMHRTHWAQQELEFFYAGADQMDRSTKIHFSQSPSSHRGTQVSFQLNIKAHGSERLEITVVILEVKHHRKKQREAVSSQTTETMSTKSPQGGDWLNDIPKIQSDSLVLNRLLDRSFRDLHMLRSDLKGDSYFGAGIPWFCTLFGRDSLITALQLLPYKAQLAEETLRLLATLQGKHHNSWRDEAPGKILHEYRNGEMARTGQIPHSPYYGSIDSTPLFLILLARHAQWTGSTKLFEELDRHVDAAFGWIRDWGDPDHDGYLDYESRPTEQLINQGWKDSGNAIVDERGDQAQAPISLVEVQGYVYAAKIEIARIYRKIGNASRARCLEKEAKSLRERFNKDFWCEESGCYGLALTGPDKRLSRVISSNAGHALWSGIAEPEKARSVMDALTSEEMFNGWGVRTLSRRELAYNPVGYHVGTVWPHDNSILAAGFRRYGFTDALLKIFEGMTEAAIQLPHYRLPELFSGCDRASFDSPVRYPVACHPQAWAAGSMPYLLQSLLGIDYDGFENVLYVRQPVFPKYLERLEISDFSPGKASANLCFERASNGSIVLSVKRASEGLRIEVEKSPKNYAGE